MKRYSRGQGTAELVLILSAIALAALSVLALVGLGSSAEVCKAATSLDGSSPSARCISSAASPHPSSAPSAAPTVAPSPTAAPTSTPTCSGGQSWNGTECACPPGDTWLYVPSYGNYECVYIPTPPPIPTDPPTPTPVPTIAPWKPDPYSPPGTWCGESPPGFWQAPGYPCP